ARLRRTACPKRASVAGRGVYISKARDGIEPNTFGRPSTGVATMKSTILRIFGGLLVLGGAWVIVPGVTADDATDYANQMDQAQKDRDDYMNKILQDNVKYIEDMRKFMDEQNRARQDALHQVQPAAAGAAAVPRQPALWASRQIAQAAPQQHLVLQNPVAF